MKSFFQNNDTEKIYLTHNKETIIGERFIQTLKHL